MSTKPDVTEDDDDFELEIEKDEAAIDIEVDDDTPEPDRDVAPLPKEIVDELEQDELEDYSKKVKTRLKQMKKVWHDERRAKETATREQHEAINYARRVMEENRRLKDTLQRGEKTLMDSYTEAAKLEIESAKREYKEAYDAGESDKLVEAQQKLNNASYRFNQIKDLKPTLQAPESSVDIAEQAPTTAPAVRLDEKTQAWQAKNTWWGTNKAMTALALGYHQELEADKGSQYVGTDEYWRDIDKTMRRRFPEAFETTDRGGKPDSRTDKRPANVVAPATRSTASKKIVLKQSEVSIAQKLGITPEQYAREIMKLEKANG